MKRAALFALLAFNQVLLNGQTSSHRFSVNVTLMFVHVVGQKPLLFDSVYSNAFGEQYSINKFRYYIGNITFKSNLPASLPIVIDTTILVDERKPDSKQVVLQVPAGNYEQVSFLLGVDSMKNTSGAQTGALDPLNDMFWTWSTGYVMAKLEGNSPASKLPRRMIEYHIGGFSGRHHVLRTVTLTNANGRPITIDLNAGKQIVIETNVNAWFSGAHALNIAENPACTSPGEKAKQYAENYSRMFTVRSITSE